MTSRAPRAPIRYDNQSSSMATTQPPGRSPTAIRLGHTLPGPPRRASGFLVDGGRRVASQDRDAQHELPRSLCPPVRRRGNPGRIALAEARAIATRLTDMTERALVDFAPYSR